MEIKIGRVYENKTKNFLIPAFKSYGEDLVFKFKNAFKLAYGVHDTLLDGSMKIRDRVVFVLFDLGYQRKQSTEFLQWLKYQKYYILDYPIAINLGHYRKHMVVLQVPYEFEDAYDQFILGNYSKMYDKETVAKYFKLEDNPYAYNILLKTKFAKEQYEVKMYEEYGIIPHIAKEFEVPPESKHEVFNNDSAIKQYLKSYNFKELQTV